MSKVALISRKPSAFFTALLLEKRGFEVTVVDGSQGQTKALRTHPFEVQVIPSNETTLKVLSRLENVLELDLQAHEVERSPVHFEGQEAKPFVGFGESRFRTVTPLSAYNVSKCISINESLSSLATKAREKFTGDVLQFTEVTGIEFDQQRMDGLNLSSGQTLKADYYIFGDAPRKYFSQIPADVVSARLRSRVLKTPAWTCVKIVFDHSKPLYLPDYTIYMIPGGTQHEPFVGQFVVTESGARSIWQTYIDDEYSDDTDLISSSIKFMRRQLQKVFSTEEFQKESVIMAEADASADFTWIQEGVSLEDNIENSILGSPLLSPYAGLLGGLEQAFVSADRLSQAHESHPGHPTILEVADTPTSC